jgi:hypothetical protein
VTEESEIKHQLDEALKAGSGPKVARFALAFLGGLVPFVGGAIGGAAGAWSDAEQDQFRRILQAWLKLQEDEIKEIGRTLIEVMARIDHQDENVRRRVESPEYLGLIKKAFRDWSGTESEKKRTMIRNLLANAASTALTSDDVVRLFLEWIDKYSEVHFAVIGQVYNHSGITRRQIWDRIKGTSVREDSADADLFKLIVHELSVGRVIRQHRETDYAGNFIRASRAPRGRNASPVLTSAFDDEKQYELTELGKQFVHYTMNEIVPRISAPRSESGPAS